MSDINALLFMIFPIQGQVHIEIKLIEIVSTDSGQPGSSLVVK